MKKWMMFALLFLVLVSSVALVAAAEAPAPSVSDVQEAEQQVQTAQNKVLEQEIIIPENLQLVARVAFGLKEGESINFNLFIVIIVLLVCFALLMQSIIQFIPFFKQKWVIWAVAVVVTFITSSTGAFIAITNFFFGFGRNIQFLQKWGLLNLALIIIVLGIFVIGLKKLLKMLKKKVEVESAENIGFGAIAPSLRR